MILAVIKEELQNIDVPYEYMRWTSPVNGAYFVGELSELPRVTEDGAIEYTFLLTGTTRGAWLDLEYYRAQIAVHFSALYGLRKATENGSVAIFYENTIPVPTGEDDLKRIQINLTIKEWKYE